MPSSATAIPCWRPRATATQWPSLTSTSTQSNCSSRVLRWRMGTGALSIAIRKQKPDLRALFVAFGVGAEACKYYGLDLTSLNYLQKPFGRDQLVARVGQLLKSPAATPPLRGPKVMRVSANPAST